MFASNVNASGLGISSNRVVIEDALRGSEYERMITIFNVTGKPLTVSLGASGDAASWVSFHEMADPYRPIESITLVSDQASFLLKIRVPQDAPNGEHRAAVLLQCGADGRSVVLGVEADLTVTVTGTQILAGEVRGISTRDVETGYPQRTKVQFRNTGNVVAIPQINVEITKDGAFIATVTSAEAEVRIESLETIEVEWDTTGTEPGDYVAHVSVSLDGEVIATKEVAFEILPVGTLTRKGTLADLSSSGQPLPGRVMIIEATFINTGQIDAKAKFVGEVYRAGELVDTIESEEILIPVGSSDILKSYLKVESPGNYNIKGHVIYEGKRTEVKEISFEVALAQPMNPTGEVTGEGGFRFHWVLIAVIAILVLALAGIMYMRKEAKSSVKSIGHAAIGG